MSLSEVGRLIDAGGYLEGMYTGTDMKVVGQVPMLNVVKASPRDMVSVAYPVSVATFGP